MDITSEIFIGAAVMIPFVGGAAAIIFGAQFGRGDVIGVGIAFMGVCGCIVLAQPWRLFFG